jgi:FkbM family methyltransferase
MIKKQVRSFLNRFNYDIVKLAYNGSDKYKINSSIEGLNLYNTPTGKFYLPAGLKKDIVCNTIQNGNYFEPDVIEVAKQYIKPNTGVLDVGSNYGQMAIFFSSLVANGVVYAFEAEPFIFKILTENIKLNNAENIKPVFGAVYNKTGVELVFPEPDFERFDSYGSYGIDPNAKQGRVVKSITIDSLNIQEPISFMKVDIQGSDLFALQGAKNTILKNKMPILFEFEEQFQNEFSTSFNDYALFVQSINYRFEKIITGINYLIVPND